MTLTQDTLVGRIAVEHPASTRTFARYGIDYCCGGGKPLATVCAERGLDPQALLEELRGAIATPEGSDRRWDQAPTEELIDHILVTYHEPLREELPRLEAMARKVLRVHGSKAPEMLSGIVTTFVALKEELEQHMLKEEQVLFPLLRGGRTAPGPITVMRHEHETAGAALARLRELTDDYEAPLRACTTWRALWAGLADLEASLHAHIHLENNVLFLRSQDAAARV